jgi:hypothetical protein
MFYHGLIIGLVCYTLVGVGVATLGPVRRQLDAAVADLRDAPATDDDSDDRSVSGAKVVAFRVVLSLLIVLLWGRFLVFALKAHPVETIASTSGRTEPRIAAER